MKLPIGLLAALALPACTTTPHIDVCKYASVRRAAYTTAITAADAYEASGQVVPYALSMGRLAGVTALGVLNVSCPVTPVG